jgi:pyruvate/2-oxoglutarate dehydrogenase complex dihydrolipoamide acyltransferase (E2) component
MDHKDLIIPTINVNDEKVTIWDIHFKNLEFIHEGETLYSVETSKAAEEYKVDFSGFVVLYVEEGDEVAVGKSAGMIFKNKTDAEAKNEKLQREKQSEAVQINASKKAIAYAEAIGFDLSLIKKDGIIKVQDIENYLASNKQSK